MDVDTDSVAQPTYVDKEEQSCSTIPLVTDSIPEAVSFDAANYFLSMGMPVPDPDTRSVKGSLFGVSYVLLVPASLKSSEKKLQSLLRDALTEIDEQINRHNELSQISRYNSALKVGESMVVGSCFLKALQIAFSLHDASEGRFDITCCMLNRVWSEELEQGRTPKCHQLRDCVVGMKDAFELDVERGELKKLREYALDLDGISKGMGVDMMATALEKISASFYLDWGGEACSRGKHPTNRAWRTVICSPPSMIALFKSWRDKKQPQIKSALARLPIEHEAACWATSGDYYQQKKFGFFHLCDPVTKMACQASNSNVASVTVLRKGSGHCAWLDAAATASVIIGSLSGGIVSAHAFLSRLRKTHDVEFHLVSRTQYLTHASEVKEMPLMTSMGGLTISDGLLAFSRNSSVSMELVLENGNKAAVATLRVCSLSPLLVSVLSNESLSKSFSFVYQNTRYTCMTLHHSGPITIASVAPAPKQAVSLRKAFETTCVCRVVMEDVSMDCSSVAMVEQHLSFNVETMNRMGYKLSVDDGIGKEVSVFFPDHGIVKCCVKEVSTFGDHLCVLCSFIDET